MADISSYPQIPSTVWWGVRNLLNKSPRAALGEDVLGVELGVQAAAAKQYLTELKRVGILNEENRATELAHKWRMSDTYSDAAREILATAYDESLLAVAPTSGDRAKAVEWFKRQGLGEGSARNKAATYFLIGSSEPGEMIARSQSSVASRGPRPSRASLATSGNADPKEQNEPTVREGRPAFPINLNLQIHISADATTDQIDAIFSAMRKHLGDARLS